MTIHTDDAATMATFDRLCSRVTARGSGITLSQLGDCMELARQMGASEPDTELVAHLRTRLGLDDDDSVVGASTDAAPGSRRYAEDTIELPLGDQHGHER